MKTHFKLWALLLLSGLFILTSCSEDDDDTDLFGNWIELGAFEGYPRSDAVAFVIDDFAYVGTGYNGDEDMRLNDFWRYDADKDYWTQIASMPGDARNGAVAFAAEGKGYVTTGYNGKDKLNDLWEYNPTLNEWEQKTNFPGTGRYDAIAFSMYNKGYVGTGYDGNLLKDLWQYDPSTDSWEAKVSIGGKKRRNATAFVLGDRAYVCNGTDNGDYLGDLWEYDALEDVWTEKREISKDANDDESYDDDYELVGVYVVSFALDGKGYLATGGPGYPDVRTWEYDPISDVWTEKTNFEGSPRYGAVGFTVNNNAFVATGRSSGFYFDDVYRFDPNSEEDEDD